MCIVRMWWIDASSGMKFSGSLGGILCDFFFSSRRRQTEISGVDGVQTGGSSD